MTPKITFSKLNSKSSSWASTNQARTRICRGLLQNFRICLIRLSRVTLTTSGLKGGKVLFQISKRKIVLTKMGPRSIWSNQTCLLKVIRIKLIRNERGDSKAKTRKVSFLKLISLTNLSRCPKWIGHLSKVHQQGAENIKTRRLTWIYPSLQLSHKASTAMELNYRSIPRPRARKPWPFLPKTTRFTSQLTLRRPEILSPKNRILSLAI